MSNLEQSIKEQNSEKLKDIKEKEKLKKKEKSKTFINSTLKKITSLFIGRNKVEYNSFLKLHDDEKIGTFEKGVTKKGSNVSIIYTNQGPIIQTAGIDLYHSRPVKLAIADIGQNEKGININAIYEGYFKNYEGVWLYAKVGKVELFKEDVSGIHSGECVYNIIIRDEKGKFVTLKNVSSDDHIIIRGKKYPCAQKIYFDLMKRYESEIEKRK